MQRIYSQNLKWWQTMKVSWSNLMVYKVNFILQVTGPVLVFFFIKYSLWYSIFQGDSETTVGSYTLETMLSYHLWAMIVAMLGLGYHSNDLAEDIRMGRVSSYLIYPFSLWEFQTSRFLAFQIVQLGIACLTAGIAFFLLESVLSTITWSAFLKGVLVSLVVGWFWFAVQYSIGLLAFWLEETWTIRVMVNIIVQFFSGAIIPLDLYPEWLIKILEWTPFPYVTYIPVKIFLGHSTDWIQPIGILLFWLVIVGGFATWIWKKGVNLYTAAGM